MDITTAALIGITLGTGLTTAGCYLTGRAAAREQLAAELLEAGQRLTSAERILAATRAELRQVQNERARERRQTAEALEEATLRLDEAQGLNAEHAALLRQASTNLELAAATWDAMTATRKARDARTVAGQLRELAAALGAERREAAA